MVAQTWLEAATYPTPLLFGVLAIIALLVDIIGLLVSRSPAVAQTEVKSPAS